MEYMMVCVRVCELDAPPSSVLHLVALKHSFPLSLLASLESANTT